jgi:hypothetical protein
LIATATAVASVVALLLFSHPIGHVDVACPSPPQQVRIVAVQLSGSERSQQILASRLGLVRSQLVTSAVCGGPIVVQVWTGSGAIRTLWGVGDQLDIHGGTERARANRVAPVVDAAMTGVVLPRFRNALADLPATQSDFLAWRMLASDAITQLGNSQHRPIDVLIASDGVQVDDRVNLNRPLSPNAATALAKSVPAQGELRGVDVTLIGVALVAGAPPPAGGVWVDAVRAFAQQTCAATGAHCTVVSASINQPNT